MQINQFCLIIRRCLDVNEKMCFYKKIVFFTVCFRFVMYILLTGAAVDFNDLRVFLPSGCQVTFLCIYTNF